MNTKIRAIDVLCTCHSLQTRDTQRLKVRRCKKVLDANGSQKKAGVAIFIIDKIDLKTKTITKR